MTSTLKQLEHDLALAKLAIAQNRIVINVLKTYPRYARDVEVLDQVPHRVLDFIHARRVIGDQEIEKVLELATHVVSQLGMAAPDDWSSRSAIMEVEEAGAGEQTGSVMEAAQIGAAFELRHHVLPSDSFRAIRLALTPSAANSGQYRLQAKAGEVGDETGPVWEGNCAYKRDKVQVEVAALSNGKRTHIAVRVESPADLKAGDKVKVTLPNVDSQTGTRELVLKPSGPAGGRIQASVTLNLEFSDFMKRALPGGMEVLLEIAIHDWMEALPDSVRPLERRLIAQGVEAVRMALGWFVSVTTEAMEVLQPDLAFRNATPGASPRKSNLDEIKKLLQEEGIRCYLSRWPTREKDGTIRMVITWIRPDEVPAEPQVKVLGLADDQDVLCEWSGWKRERAAQVLNIRGLAGKVIEAPNVFVTWNPGGPLLLYFAVDA